MFCYYLILSFFHDTTTVFYICIDPDHELGHELCSCFVPGKLFPSPSLLCFHLLQSGNSLLWCFPYSSHDVLCLLTHCVLQQRCLKLRSTKETNKKAFPNPLLYHHYSSSYTILCWDILTNTCTLFKWNTHNIQLISMSMTANMNFPEFFVITMFFRHVTKEYVVMWPINTIIADTNLS
jgi:hypothetical protein